MAAVVHSASTPLIHTLRTSGAFRITSGERGQRLDGVPVIGW